MKAIIFLLALLAPPLAGAQERPAAVIVDAVGDVQPTVLAGAEVAPGQIFSLDALATFDFVHYASCTFVSLRGGTVDIEGDTYHAKGGTVLREETASCPTSRRASLARSDEASGMAGLLLRGAGLQQRIQTRPRFVLTGAAANEISALEVAESDRLMAHLQVIGRQAAWPSDAPSLTAGSHYIVRFLHRDGSVTAVMTLVSAELRSDGSVLSVGWQLVV